jgi:hypothetical protein
MASTIWGIVKEGKIIPDSPLPDGLKVEITLPDQVRVVPPELQDELNAWAQGSAEALALVERIAVEGTADAEG